MIKKLRSNIITGIKNRKINVFFLFLLLSFLILIFSKLSKEYTNTRVFNIHKTNVPKEYVILNDSNNKLNIVFKTHGFNWLKYYFSKPEITVDFKGDVTKVDSLFVFNKSRVFLNSELEFGSQVELLNVSPDNLYFRYDVNLIKKVPVVVNANINYMAGYDSFNSYKISPDSIQVVGPNLLVENIKSIQTEKMVLENIKSDIDKTIKLKLPKNNKDLIFSSDEVNLTAEVEKFTEGSLKIPIILINVPEGLKIKYFPKSINVIYYTSLNKFNEISVKDFKVVCDYSKVSNNQTFLLPELDKITQNVKSAKINQQHIDFIITE
ncbi:YbbR-like domain-containing protein [Gaetbulibacter aquiaggeris]|uniref:YbbR-like domain-containing protein n=1 Tax=Gaetbulibacter aquiaggeris TaxID=1735373 RepID=A0ABW7MUD6_9FLAO